MLCFNPSFCHFCYYNHTWRPASEPCPLCLTLKLKCLCIPHRETFWPCPPVNSFRKEEITTSPPQTWPSKRYFARLIAFLFYFLISSPSLSYKRNWHPDPIRWYPRALARLPSSQTPGFPIKIAISCLSISFPDYWPIVWQADQAWIQ